MHNNNLFSFKLFHWEVARQSIAALRAMLLCISATVILSGVVHAQDERLSGVWLIETPPVAVKTVNGKAPPLLPEAKQQYQQNLAAFKSGDLTAFDTATWCSSPGIPRLMLMPYPFQLIVRPLNVTFLYEWDRWARIVDMTTHLPPLFPAAMGSASGHWDGKTLVVETDGLADNTLIDSSGLQHSDQMKVTERLLLKGDDRLEDRIRIEDPSTFSAAWETVVTYRRQPAGTHIAEDVCLDRIKHEPAVKTSKASK